MLIVILPTLHHAGVVTRNIETMIEWYTRVPGIESKFESFTLSNTTLGKYVCARSQAPIVETSGLFAASEYHTSLSLSTFLMKSFAS